jgi:uncharacterized repeat protein (TIGR02543 family)
MTSGTRPYIQYDGKIWVLHVAEAGYQRGYQKAQYRDFGAGYTYVYPNGSSTRLHSGSKNSVVYVTDLPGSESTGTGVNQDQLQYAYFLYVRNAFKITFSTGTSDFIPDATPIKVGDPLAPYEPANPSKDGYIFEGWCTENPVSNPGCNPFNFATEEMPGSNLLLYAKFSANDVHVDFYDAVGSTLSPVATKATSVGGTVSDPGTWTLGQAVPGKGMFEGWVWLAEGKYPITFTIGTTPVYIDTDVYATWRTTGFTVTYDPGAGTWVDTTDPLTDDNTYDLNQQARVKDGIGRLVPPTGKVFYGWTSATQGEGVLSYPYNLHVMDGDTTLVAFYGDLASSMKVVYHPTISPTLVLENYSSTEVVEQWYPTGSNVYLAGTIYTAEYQELVGWAESSALATASDAVAAVDTGTSGYYKLGYYPYTTSAIAGSEVHLYAVWKMNEYYVDFLADNGGSIKVSDSDIRGPFETYRISSIQHGTAWASLTLPTPVPDSGKCFTGWTPDFPATVTQSRRFTANFAACPPPPVETVTVEYRLDSATGTLAGSATLGSYEVGTACSVVKDDVLAKYSDAKNAYGLAALAEGYEDEGTLVDCGWTSVTGTGNVLTVWFAKTPDPDPDPGTSTPEKPGYREPEQLPSHTPDLPEVAAPTETVVSSESASPKVNDPSDPDDLPFTGFDGQVLPFALVLTVLGAGLALRARRK